jgi:dGTPase
LAHDLGHPPFGHQGEFALNKKMLDYGGFEGNAQTLRIIAKLEKKFQEEFNGTDDERFGLNLTYRTLASMIKYDGIIPSVLPSTDKIKGLFECDQNVLDSIKTNLGTGSDKLYTIEAQIMDIADDIAYSTYDLEDA